MKLIFLVCLLNLFFLHSTIGHPQCNANEEYNACGGCDQICNKEPMFCTLDCSNPGCYCMDGFVRSWEGGECVPKSSCPSQCNANEEYRECGGCDQICNKEPMFCTLDCSNPGCYCMDGYVRSFEGGSCVPESSCPPQCPTNEVYKECYGCDQINKLEPIACAGDCSSPGCYCRDGYIRSCKGGACLPDSNYFCSENEEYKVCGTCDQICNKEPVICFNHCYDPGCYCKKGYVRSSEGGRCVSENTCMPKCPMNEVYKECGGCDQINKLEPISCSAHDCSSPGCYCKEGFIRACEGGACIKDSKYFCSENEEYKVCGGCDQICNKEPAFCSNHCHDPGCYCKEGYVRLSKGGRCVLKNNCYQCREDEVFNSCGPKFEDCCERETNSNQIQPADFCQPGCYCPHGYLRAGPSNRTMCVPKDKCKETNKCPENEEYRMCGPSHQDSCDRKHCPQKCGGKLRSESSQKCVADCFCKPGFIREHADTQAKRYKCVPEGQCPKPCKT